MARRWFARATRRFWSGAVALASVCLSLTAGAQAGKPASAADPLSRGLEAEDKRDRVTATVAYREALTGALAVGSTDGDRIAVALLGLERVWNDAGMLDSIVPVVSRVLQFRPTDPTARGVQLRTLISMGRDAEARDAFTTWRRAAGNEAAPFREYARLLLQAGRALAADSVLSEAGRLMGAAGALSGETAQLHLALKRYVPAVRAFREAMVDEPWLETAALFGLQRVPSETRDSVRTVLLAPPVTFAPRRLLSSLEFAWGEPRRAWSAISTLPADDSTTATWRSFAERAELNESWLVARDAWTAVFDRAGDIESQQRAADASLRAGDAAAALSIVRRKSTVGTVADSVRVRALLGLEIAALGELGRGNEAQQKLDDAAKKLDPDTRASLARPLVAGWLRAGEVARAKAAMHGTELADDDEMAGWLALYEGDVVNARKRLLRAASNRPELVDALGILARTRVEQLPGLGDAFATLARKDSTGAAKRFVQLADSVGAAAPAFIAQGARLSRKNEAIVLYDRIVRDFPRSPEAPEALLAWARALRDAGDKPAAVTKFEQLLVDYGTSALAPQARRDLERLKGAIPPAV
ncbi:MAG: tetratricopeptide repeat protein [Acidobacteriota bacterium]